VSGAFRELMRGVGASAGDESWVEEEDEWTWNSFCTGRGNVRHHRRLSTKQRQENPGEGHGCVRRRSTDGLWVLEDSFAGREILFVFENLFRSSFIHSFLRMWTHNPPLFSFQAPNLPRRPTRPGSIDIFPTNTDISSNSSPNSASTLLAAPLSVNHCRGSVARSVSPK